MTDSSKECTDSWRNKDTSTNTTKTTNVTATTTNYYYNNITAAPTVSATVTKILLCLLQVVRLLKAGLSSTVVTKVLNLLIQYPAGVKPDWAALKELQ